MLLSADAERYDAAGRLRIFHGLDNIAGLAGVLSAAQRALGADAFSYCYPTHHGYPVDRTVQNMDNPVRRRIELLSFFVHEARRFDVFQFYYDKTLFEESLIDVPWLKRMGKSIFFYFHGCDVRDSKYNIGAYDLSVCKDCWPMACSPNRAKLLDYAHQYADGVFVSTPDLLQFVPGSELLPQAVDMARFGPLRDAALAAVGDRIDRERVIIAHAPSGRMFKGTKYIEAAVEALQAEGCPVELCLIENVSHEEALRLAAGADLAIDQVLAGAYGKFAVEAMALGKPVIVYIRDDLRGHYPDELPVISARPHTLVDTILRTIDRRDAWEEIGKRGMAYVEAHHNSSKIAAQMLACYMR